MADSATAIRVRGLSRLFANRVVFAGVDFDVAEGETVALTGANGAGKTTLLRCLASLLRPTAGAIEWFGRAASANPAARRLVGMAAHESLLYPHLTLRENLVFAGRMTAVRDPLDRADRLLGGAGLASCAHCFPRRISKGMRQRLAVLRALVHDPPILLLDEPFSSLDGDAAEWLLGVLADLRGRRCTICFATHDATKVQQLADRVFCLQSGRLSELPRHESHSASNHPAMARAA